MTVQAEINAIYARWGQYGASPGFIRKNLVEPLEGLGYAVAVDPSGSAELRFHLPDGRRLGHLNTESFYFVDARDIATAQDSPLLVTDTAAGNQASHPRTPHNSQARRNFILDVARRFAATA